MHVQYVHAYHPLDILEVNELVLNFLPDACVPTTILQTCIPKNKCMQQTLVKAGAGQHFEHFENFAKLKFCPLKSGDLICTLHYC